MRERSLPLGIDIGAARIRIVQARMTVHGPRMNNVAVRDVARGAASSGVLGDPEYVSTLIEDALGELGTRERRCVCGIGEPDAFLRPVSFPRMTHLERLRNAAYEAKRYVAFPPEETIVRIHRPARTSGDWMLGIARKSAVSARSAALRRARLRPVAMDHEFFALQRALPGYDAILDIGLGRTNLHVFGPAPRTLVTFNGGSDITRTIASDLSIDVNAAEKRKRILGTAGAGERGAADLVSDIAALVGSARSMRAIERIALVGNGARLPGLMERVRAAANLQCEVAVSEVFLDERHPPDVVRAAAPDWALAAGLAVWGAET